MDSDPRIGLIIGGIILTIIGISIPSEIDVANQMKGELEVLYEKKILCGENIQCQNSAKQSIRALETSLNAVQLNNNLSSTFFWFGILASVGSGGSFILTER